MHFVRIDDKRIVNISVISRNHAILCFYVLKISRACCRKQFANINTPSKVMKMPFNIHNTHNTYSSSHPSYPQTQHFILKYSNNVLLYLYIWKRKIWIRWIKNLACIHSKFAVILLYNIIFVAMNDSGKKEDSSHHQQLCGFSIYIFFCRFDWDIFCTISTSR